MCLILVGVNARAGSRVMLLANRDEFHARPAAAAAPWSDAPGLLGGRDLRAGGTWLAVRNDGRFAAVTNLRNGEPRVAPRSRGDLVSGFLRGNASASSCLDHVLADLPQFAPFNLVLGDVTGVYALDGSTQRVRVLADGLHLIGNGPLDVEWPKARRLRMQVRSALEQGSDEARLIDLLRDRARPADEQLPDTGIGLERERLLSPIFIEGDAYGTRASTWLDMRDDGEIRLVERSFGPGGTSRGEVAWRHSADAGGWQRVSSLEGD